MTDNAQTPVAPALAGVKVLAFIQGIAGPLLGMTLAGFGATVVRVESRTRLELHRQIGPYLGKVPTYDGTPGYLCFNGGQSSITVNMKHPQASHIMGRAIRWADVMIENFAPGALARMGLAYEDVVKIRPDIIVLNSSMFGETGPYATMRGYGGTLTAATGLAHITGDPDQPPQSPGTAITDYIAPRIALMAIATALDYRRRTGRGQLIDAAQVESVLPLMAPLFLEYQARGVEPMRNGNRSERAAPHGVYRCQGREGWCAITVFTEDEWSRFGVAIGSPAWVRREEFRTLAGRLEHVAELDRLVEEWTINQPAQEVMLKLQQAGVTAGAMQRGSDLGQDPQLKHRGFYKPVDHPGIGPVTYGGLSPVFSGTPYETRRAPYLGEHTEAVFVREMGMPRDEYEQLKSEGAFE